MNEARGVARLNRRILEDFSRRTTRALHSALPLRLALPHLERVLALNVAKEVRKDALVICRAGETDENHSAEDMLRQMLDASKEIDDGFLARVGPFPVDIVIRYDEIVPIRRKRIELLFATTLRILAARRVAPGLRAALQAACPRQEFELLIRELLLLYAQETRLVSRSVRLPALLAPLREKIARELYQIMNEVAYRLAADIAAFTYGPKRVRGIRPTTPG